MTRTTGLAGAINPVAFQVCGERDGQGGQDSSAVRCECRDTQGSRVPVPLGFSDYPKIAVGLIQQKEDMA